jgi:Protein of unknown function (DUF974)
MLQLPTGTELMLGETLNCYVRLINLADAALTNIAVKARRHRRCEMKVSMLHIACAWSVLYRSDDVGSCGLQCELKTDRQRLMLHDTSSKPLKRLAASEGYDFLLRHDVKEPNDHVLTFRCAMLLHMHPSMRITCARWPCAGASSQPQFEPFHAVRHTQQEMAVHGLSSKLSSFQP